MNLRRLSLWIISIIVIALLAGCVSFEEDISVNPNGGGTLRFAYGVETSAYDQFTLALPQEYQLESLFSTLAQDENVTDVRLSNYEENGITWQTIEIDIVDLQAVFGDGRRFGPIIVTVSEEDGIYTFEQVLDLNLANVAVPGMYLLDIADANYQVQLDTPQIIDTNGLQPKAGTSTWQISLPDLVNEQGSIYLNAQYILTPYEGFFVPWEMYFPYLVYGFLGLGIISVLVIIIVNTSRKVEKEQKLHF